MSVDLNKTKKKRAEIQSSGEFWNPNEGDTRLYLGAPCRGEADVDEPTTGLPFIELKVHYSVGDKEGMTVCHNQEVGDASILRHPFVVEQLRKRGVVLPAEGTECPVCQAIYNGDMDQEKAQKCRAQTRYMWWVVPTDFRASSAEQWNKLHPKAVVYFCGQTVHTSFLDAINENGDITDPNAAVLVKVEKKGKGLATKYKVQVDVESAKRPIKLSKEVVRICKEATKPEGGCDLFKVVANMYRNPADVMAMLTGVKVEEGEGEATEDGSKSCYGLDWNDDEECAACEYSEQCKAECEGAAEAEDEEAAEDEEEAAEDEEPAPKPKPKPQAKPQAKPAPKPQAKPQAKVPGKPPTKPAAQAPKPVPKPTMKPGVKAKPKANDDAELDELAAQLKKMGAKKKGK